MKGIEILENDINAQYWVSGKLAYIKSKNQYYMATSLVDIVMDTLPRLYFRHLQGITRRRIAQEHFPS